MPGWTIPKGPSDDEFLARVREIHLKIEAKVDGDIERQHLVSQVILKPFGLPDDKGEGCFLVPHHVKYGRQKPRSVRECAKQADFLKGASESAETLWNSTVETKLGPAVAAAREGKSVSDPSSISILRDAIALHCVRSYHWRGIHDTSVERAMGAVRAGLLQSRLPLIDDTFRRRTGGLLPGGDESRLLVIDEAMSNWMRWRQSGALARAAIEFRFAQFREIFRRVPLEILHAPPGKTFLISDSPAVSVRWGRDPKQAALLQGPIGDANTVLFPIAPDCLLALSNRNADTIISPELVDMTNLVQVRGARKYVYYRNGAAVGRFVDLTLKRAA